MLDWVIKSWPLLTVGAIVVGVCHGAGCFHYVGQAWLSVLTFSDIVALTWAVIPSLLAIAPVGILIAQFASRNSVKRAVDVVHEKEGNSPRRIALRTVGMIVSVGGWVWSLALPVQFGQFAVLLVPAASAGTLLLMLTSTTRAMLNTSTAFLVTLSCFAFPYAAGQARGAAVMQAAPNDYVRLETRIECVRIVFAGSGGILFAGDRGGIRYRQWNEVQEVGRDTGCDIDA
jgi:hypothetical protein